MKNNILLIIGFLLFTSFAKGQQTTNAAGDNFTQGNNVITFSIGETINDLFSTSEFSLKAGVIQSFYVACPLPNIFSFQQINNACIPEGGAISLALSGSEPNVRYQLSLNGIAIGDSIIGTGNPLTLLSANQSGVYAVKASYPGKKCSVDLPQQITLKQSPQVSIVSPSVNICSGQNTSIQLTATEPVLVNYSLISGSTKQINITDGSITVPIVNAQVGSSISISSVESVATGCVNSSIPSIPIPVSPIPTITLSQTKIPCAGEVVELNYNSNEGLSYTYTLTGAPIQNTLTALTGVISLQNLTSASNLTLTNIKSLQSGCQNTSSLTFPIKIDQKPVLSAVNIAACSNESFSLDLSSSPTVNVSWKANYNGAKGGAGTGTTTSTLIENLINEGINPIQVSYELTPEILNNPGCKGNPIISTVTVNAAPQIITPSNISDFCGGSVINIPILTSGGGVVKWRRINSQISGTGNILDVAENTSGQSIVLNYALELGGCKNVITKTLALKVSPEPILNINQVPVLCNAFTDLTESSVTSGSTAGIQLQYFQDADLTLPIPDATKVSRGTYFIKGEVAGCTTKTSITIRSQLKLRLTIKSEPICPDKKIDLAQLVDNERSSPNLSLTYWTNSDATIPLVNPQLVDAGTYYVKGLDASSTCSIVKPIRVKAYQEETINLPTNLTVCSGNVFTFNPTLKESTFKWIRNVNGALGLSGNAGTGGISELLTITNNDPEVELSYGYSVGAPGCDATVGTFKVKVTKGPSFELIDSARICDAYINLNSIIKSPGSNLNFSYFLNDTLVSDLTKGIQGTYRVEGTDGQGCKTTKSLTVNHQLEVPTINPFISCPPLTLDLKSKLTNLFNSTYAVSFEDISTPDKVYPGTYTVGLKPLNGACKLILPVIVQSVQPQLLNPIGSVSLCSGEKFTFEPAFSSKDITYLWSYQNGNGNGKIEAVWNNKSNGFLSDSIKIVSTSSACNQNSTQFIKIEIQPELPKLIINASDVCSDKLLNFSVLASPDNSSAKFSWKASYGVVEGGFNGNAINSFGNSAIKERLYHEEDTAVTVRYMLQAFLPGLKTCYGPIETFSIDVLPIGFGPCTGTLAGIIKTINKQFVEGVKVQVSGLTGDKTVNTKKDGLFKFSGLENGGDYSIYPELNKNPLNGVSTYDLLLMQKHILNIRVIESPYELIAADVNKSGSISIADILQLRKLILGIDKDFKDNKSWRFVDAKYTFKKESNPFRFPEIVNINDLNGSAEAYFYGVKIGDLNGNVAANSTGLGDLRELNEYSLQSVNKSLRPGEIFPLTLHADQTLQAEGMQFTLQYDPQKLHFESLLADSSLLSMVGIFDQEGMLTLSFASKMKPDSKVLTLPFKALQAGELSEMVQISDRITRAEAYIEEKTMPVNILFTEKSDAPKILSPFPNPFIDVVNIPYYLPQETEVTLDLYDFSGRLVRTMVQNGNAGMNKFVIDNLSFGSEWKYEMKTTHWKTSGTLISVNR